MRHTKPAPTVAKTASDDLFSHLQNIRHRRPVRKKWHLLNFGSAICDSVVNSSHLKADATLLSAALIGYQQELMRIEQAMAEIRRQVGAKAIPSLGPAPARKRRTLSAAAGKRIAAAQKKRWAEYKKRKAA